MHGGETETGAAALGLGGEERLEDPRGHLGQHGVTFQHPHHPPNELRLFRTPAAFLALAFPVAQCSHVGRLLESADLEGPHTAYPLPLLVPQVDRDGNELSGIRLPNVAVPLATYTGWNFRNPSIGQPGELLPLTGSYIPFAVTKAAREEARDPRMSIEERYGNRAQYHRLVTDAATRLVQAGYLLNEDVDWVVERALANWDAITRGTTLAGN